MKNLPETSFDRNSEFLLISARGTFNTEWFIDLISTMAVKINEFNCKGILLDMRGLSGKVNFIDRYRIGHKAATTVLGIFIAVVGNEPLVDPKRFGEMVARNRGANVRVFTDYDEADTWLRKYLSLHK